MKITEVDIIEGFDADLFAHLIDFGEFLELDDNFIGLHIIDLNQLCLRFDWWRPNQC